MMYELFSQFSRFLSEPFFNIASITTGIPLLSAFVLGIVGALAPCQFTSNIGAITIYGNQSLQKGVAWKEVFLFILGKIFVFTALGLLVWGLGQEFQSSLTAYFPWIRKLMGPFFILIGLYLIGFLKMYWTLNFGRVPKNLTKGKFGAFFMGISFSLGFCPTMFVLFFGSLMRLVLSTSYGVTLPSIFAIGTSIPLIITILIIWYLEIDKSVMKKKGRKIGVIVQKVAGVLMVFLGILDTITYWT